MTFGDFISQNNGKYVDFDQYYGAQCVDLVQFYARDVVGAPKFTGNAKDIYFSYPTAYYDRFPNTITAIPQKGDIIIWGDKVGGGYGHIGICTSANVLSFSAFNQNWPLNSPAHIQSFNNLYYGVLGWLRPKAILVTTDSQRVQKIKDEVNSQLSDADFRNWVRSYLQV